MDGWKINFLLGRPIFSCYVSFREGIYIYKTVSNNAIFSISTGSVDFFSIRITQKQHFDPPPGALRRTPMAFLHSRDRTAALRDFCGTPPSYCQPKVAVLDMFRLFLFSAYLAHNGRFLQLQHAGRKKGSIEPIIGY